MIINLQNIENFLFFDKKIKNLFPEFRDIFNQYAFGKSTGLEDLSKRTIIDFMNLLEPQHLIKLEEYFKEKISLDKIDYRIVKNMEFSLLEENISLNGYKEIALFRNKDKLKVTLWK